MKEALKLVNGDLRKQLKEEFPAKKEAFMQTLAKEEEEYVKTTTESMRQEDDMLEEYLRQLGIKLSDSQKQELADIEQRGSGEIRMLQQVNALRSLHNL